MKQLDNLSFHGNLKDLSDLPKSFDEYEIRARYFPAILSSIPLIMLTSLAKQDVIIGLFKTSDFFLIIENISLSLIFIVFLINIQRFVAKYLFEDRIFDYGNNFPTTKILLWSDYRLASRDLKLKLHDKISEDFDISLSNENQENEELGESTKKAKDAVSLVRRKVGKGKLTLQHNIQYGFMRNLIAGSLFSLPVALLNIYIFALELPIAYGLYISIGVVVIDLVFLLFCAPILRRLAESYAEILFSEYLTL